MFGGVNVWRIVELKEIDKIKFSELIDFSHKDNTGQYIEILIISQY